MKVLVVGVGSIGQRHLRVIQNLGHEVTVCDVNPTLLREVRTRYSLSETYRDYCKALRHGVDVVVVSTPNHLHAPIATAAFRNGCHVLMEKPLAHTLESGKEIVEAAESSGRVLLVGYILRQWQEIHTLREWLNKERIGRVYAVRAMVGSYTTLTVARSDYRNRREEGGGVILDYTHELDYLRLLLGEVASVVALAKPLPVLPLETEGIAAMLLQFECGAIGEVHMDYLQRPGRRHLELYGELGMLTYNFDAGRLSWKNWNGESTEQKSRVTWRTGRDEAYKRQFETLTDLIAGQNVVPEHYADGYDALKTLAVASAVLRSVEEGRFIRPRMPTSV